jgi:hypothetical protein
VNLNNINQLIDACCVQGEFLSTLQDSMSIVGMLMPDSNGTSYWIKADPAMNFANRHKMGAVLDGLNGM